MFKKFVLLAVAMSLTCGYCGKEFFPIGAYSPEPKNDKNVLAIKNAGFNTLLTYQSSNTEIDKLLALAVKHEMKVFVILNHKYVKENNLEAMRATVRRYKDHPSVVAWYLYDEPSPKKGVTPDTLMLFYRMLKEETPDIPVAIVSCWDETWDQYSSVLDWQMVDIYPVHDQEFPRAPIQTVTTFVQQAVNLGKPVIPVLQTLNWQCFRNMLPEGRYSFEKLRFPNLAELRYMVFGSMTIGVNGMFGYSYYHAMRIDSKWWFSDCSLVFNELKDFIATVKKPSQPHIFRRANDGNYMASVWNNEYLIVVNAWPFERKFSGIWCEDYFNKDYELIPWGSTRKVKGEITKNRIKTDISIEPWEVLIWKIQEK